MEFPPLTMEKGWSDYEYYNGSYESLIESTGLEILVNVADDDWSGDSILLVRDGDQYGQLNYGWGSCSGCDALQGCETLEDYEELRRDLVCGVIWDTLENTVMGITNRDWEVSYYGESLGLCFVKEVEQYLLTLKAD
jgi:hypothetical protein